MLHLVVGALARGVPEVAQVEREGAVVLQLDDLLHRFDVARLAIRRETHHLVFVAVVRKADELRHRLVEYAERMGKVDAAVDGEGIDERIASGDALQSSRVDAVGRSLQRARGRCSRGEPERSRTAGDGGECEELDGAIRPVSEGPLL